MPWGLALLLFQGPGLDIEFTTEPLPEMYAHAWQQATATAPSPRGEAAAALAALIRDPDGSVWLRTLEACLLDSPDVAQWRDAVEDSHAPLRPPASVAAVLQAFAEGERAFLRWEWPLRRAELQTRALRARPLLDRCRSAVRAVAARTGLPLSPSPVRLVLTTVPLPDTPMSLGRSGRLAVGYCLEGSIEERRPAALLMTVLWRYESATTGQGIAFATELWASRQGLGLVGFPRDSRALNRLALTVGALAEAVATEERRALLPEVGPVALERMVRIYRETPARVPARTDPKPSGNSRPRPTGADPPEAADAGPQEGELALKLLADQRVLLPGEEPFLWACLENRSARRLFVPTPRGRHGYAWTRLVRRGQGVQDASPPRISCGNTQDSRTGIWLDPGQSFFQRVRLDRGQVPAVGTLELAIGLRWKESSRAFPPGADRGPHFEAEADVPDESLALLPRAGDFQSAPVVLDFAVPEDGPGRSLLHHVLPDDRFLDGLRGTSSKAFNLMRTGIEEHGAGPWGRTSVYELAYSWSEPRRHLHRRERDGWTSIDTLPLGELIAEVEAWEIGRWTDDALYAIAEMLEERGRRQVALALWIHVSTRYPERDHGIRARARWQGRELLLER